MINYPSDDYLIRKIREHDDNCFNLLCSKYMPLLKMVANYEIRTFNVKQLTADDFIFTYFLTLNKTVESFNLNCDDFESYLFIALKRSIRKEINNFLVSKENTSFVLSLDDPIDDGITLKDVIPDENDISPSRYVDLDETRLILSGKTRTYVSEEELLKSQAITLKIFGYTMREIAKRLNVPLSRIRRYLDKNDESYKNIIIRLK